jgi:hypothetical protein
MPKTKDSEKTIPKLYRRKFEDTALLFYVEGQKDIIPAITVEKAILNFFRKIGEENYNLESAITTYSNLKKEYFELLRS